MNPIEHLLMNVSEQAVEVVQMAGKCGVFGISDSNPKYGNIPNIDLLLAETNDLLAVIEMLGDRGVDVSALGDRNQITLKKIKVTKWMLYAEEKGNLTYE